VYNSPASMLSYNYNALKLGTTQMSDTTDDYCKSFRWKYTSECNLERSFRYLRNISVHSMYSDITEKKQSCWMFIKISITDSLRRTQTMINMSLLLN
jgi:hypothetical protein